MARYLITDRFQTSFHTDEITDDDLTNCEAGVINIIDSKKGLTFFEDEWIKIEEWKGLDYDC